MKTSNLPPWVRLGTLPAQWFMQSENGETLNSEIVFDNVTLNIKEAIIHALFNDQAIKHFSNELNDQSETFKQNLSNRIDAIIRPIYTTVFTQLGKGLTATTGGIIGGLLILVIALGVYTHVELTTAALACIALVIAALAVSIGFAIKGVTMLKDPVSVLTAEQLHPVVLSKITEQLPTAIEAAVNLASTNKMNAVNQEDWVIRAGQATVRGSTKKSKINKTQLAAITFGKKLANPGELLKLLPQDEQVSSNKRAQAIKEKTQQRQAESYKRHLAHIKQHKPYKSGLN